MTPLAYDPVLPDGRALTVSRRAVVRVVLFAAAFFVGSSVFTETEQAPPRAVVFADPVAHTYTSPACASASRRPLDRTTVAAARAGGMQPDAECWRNGGFLGTGASEWIRLLQGLHLYHQRESRWRPDGSWRW